MATKNMSLGKKLMGTILLVSCMLVIVGGVAYWAMNNLVESVNVASNRLEDASKMKDLAIYAIKQYQNQADLIINQDKDLINEFEKSSAKFEAASDHMLEIIDTPEERAWAAKVVEADEALDKTFHEGIVPTVERILENRLKKYDGEADVLIADMEMYARKIEASMLEEFILVSRASNDKELIRRASDLDAINRMLYWVIKQYQNQADLIINQDLDIINDFKVSVEQMDKYKELVRAAVDTPAEIEWVKKIDEIDEKYDNVFFNKVVPEVQWILKKEIQRLDGETDESLAEVEDNVNKLIASIGNEADEAIESYRSTASMVKTVMVVISFL